MDRDGTFYLMRRLRTTPQIHSMSTIMTCNDDCRFCFIQKISSSDSWINYFSLEFSILNIAIKNTKSTHKILSGIYHQEKKSALKRGATDPGSRL